MPAPAVPASAAASRATAVKGAATAASAAKPGKPASTDTASDTNTDADTPAPASSSAWLPPDLRVPTLQPAASIAAGGATWMNAAVTNDTEESEPTPAPATTADTSADGTSEVAKSVTDAVAMALNADAPAAGTQPSTPADAMPSATAAAAAAQAGALHNAVHSQSSMEEPPVLRAAVGSAAWTEELGTQVTWMARHGQDSALLHLSPEHLGPVEVRIDVRDGATSVWFGAAHADTRSALEQSLPRLRELFAASGLMLADAGVARDAPRQNARPVAALPLAGNAADASISNSQVASASAHTGLVDTYV
jgi:flagellar hook-length control protein FliK